MGYKHCFMFTLRMQLLLRPTWYLLFTAEYIDFIKESLDIWQTSLFKTVVLVLFVML